MSLRNNSRFGLSDVTRTPPASTVKTPRLNWPVPSGFWAKKVIISPTVVPELAISNGMSQKLSMHEIAVSLPFGVEKPNPVRPNPGAPNPGSRLTWAGVPPKLAALTLKILNPGTEPPAAGGEVTSSENGV